MTILDKIIAEKRNEISEKKKEISIAELEKRYGFQRESLSLKESLLSSSSGIIAEFKRKSPSKGWIHSSANVKEITSGYSQKGASGISILTDTVFFGGSLSDLMEARPFVDVPVLRKDFIIDEYQLYEARAVGADVILLIAAALTPRFTRDLALKAKKLSLEVLLEIHDEKELEHLCPEVDMVGVNNRNLKTFLTDINSSFRLAGKIPDSYLKISESGLSSAETVRELRQAGYKGFLMGENFMKEKDPVEALELFIKQIEKK
jgi:indole-3-glycerol phosphate synthase